LITELAEFAGIGVFESNMTNNISHDSPCFLGFAPDKHLPNADVGLLVDVDVPWFPSDVEANASTFWAHIDVDILKPASPMWTFPGHLRMQGSSARILEQVVEELKARATPAFTQAAQGRVARLTAERDARLERARKLAADKGKRDAINPHYLFAELGKLLAPEDLVFNEGVRNAGAALMQIDRPLPGTIMRAGGGGLGWSGAMALGAKLAAPGAADGSDRGRRQLLFRQSVFGVRGGAASQAADPCDRARQFRLVRGEGIDPAGVPRRRAKSANEFQAGLMPGVEFGKIGEAFGAYAEKLDDPADVPAALARCVKEVRGGRSAILHARVTPL
jgi:acetolactate synthase-1/2/3 large subunit